MSEDQPTTPHFRHAGFWPRLGAWLIDTIALGIIGLVVGQAFYDQLLALTWEGKILGLVLAYPYLAILNSRIGNGATIGKHVLKLKVVDRAGQTISLARSSIRYLIFALPYFLNGFEARVDDFESVVGQAVGIILLFVIFIGGGSVVYLFLFNRRNRRSLHDLITGTMVIRLAPADQSSPWDIWRPHVSVVGLTATVGTLGVAYLISALEPKLLGDLRGTYDQVLQIPGISTAQVFRGATVVATAREGQRTIHDVSVSARLDHRPEDVGDYVERLATMIYQRPELLTGVDVLNIEIRWGFDIGIASWWTKEKKALTPDQWKLDLRA